MGSPEFTSPDRSRQRYSFGDYELDLEGGFLRRGGEEIALRPKSFDVLAYLVKHHGRLVTKTALIDAVWPDTAITDNSLAHCLVEIRRALADESQQLIRTVARRGYVFTAPVITPVLEFPNQAGAPVVATEPAARRRVNRLYVAGGLILAAVVAAGWTAVRLARPVKPEIRYTQITNFTDSAVAPVLSPDGRMLAFLRSDKWFLSTDQAYLTILPNGEPVQLTNDPRRKCCIAFSPDGSRLAYTVTEPDTRAWNTYTVPVLGGEPRLLLSNAAGLTWLDQRRLLFSEISTGFHMGMVTATESRSEYRKIYFPQHERGMVHYSYASPDRKWALAVEMDPIWQPCRVVPLDGSSGGRQVGPAGSCTAAAWSPDGKWMYFSAAVNSASHLWRQRFPRGEPEQMTFGPAEEEGVAVAPDGRSLITSVGMHESVIWIRDARGERQLSSEGFVEPMRLRAASFPSARFSADGKSLFYLTRRGSPSGPSELWRTDVESGKSEPLLPGVSMAEYDLSMDLKKVVFSTHSDGRTSEVWIAHLDRSTPPRRLTPSGAASPQFGPDGEVLFQWMEGNAYYLVRTNKAGSGISKVRPQPVGNIWGRSPDHRWVVGFVNEPEGAPADSMAIAASGGAVRRICDLPCPVAWAPDGRYLYVGVEARSRTSAGKTVAIPVPPGETFPDLPPSGIRGLEDASAFPGSRVIDGWMISPGPDPSVFAYTKLTMRRNLFRIALAGQ